MNSFDKLISNATQVEGFSKILTMIISYEKEDNDDKSWDLIHHIEEIEPSRYVHLLIASFDSDAPAMVNSLLYQSLWHGVINSPQYAHILIKQLQDVKNIKVVKEIVSFIRSLDDQSSDTADNNIRQVLAKIS